MRKIMWVCAGMLMWGCGASQASTAGDGVQPSEANQVWAHLHGRLTLGAAASIRNENIDQSRSGQRVGSLSLMGDYYVSRPFGLGNAGGLRATSGVLLGPRSSLWGSAAVGGMFSIERRHSSAPFDNSPDNGTAPYLGVGYTGLSTQGGWEVSADFGLMALSRVRCDWDACLTVCSHLTIGCANCAWRRSCNWGCLIRFDCCKGMHRALLKRRWFAV